MKIIQARAKFLICTMIILFTMLAIIPKDADDITNAAINPNNGDIAFCYYESDISPHGIRVEMYDKDGEFLFSKITSTGDGGSYADLLFIDGNLYVRSGRSYLRFCFDRMGNELGYDIPYEIYEEVKSTREFEGWKWGLRKRTFQYEDYLYTYNPPIIFRDKALLTVTNGDGEVTVIYKDPWYD